MTIPKQVETVRDYHQGLAHHLLELIRKTTSAALDATPRKPSLTSVTPPAPANPRQHSDSSLESDSRVSSGVTTTESRKSSVIPRRESGSQVDDIESHVRSPEADHGDGGRRGSGDFVDIEGAAAEAYRLQQSGGSSGRHDLTARPDQHPSRFPSLSPLADHYNTDTQHAESSATGAQRYSVAAAVQSPPSPSSRLSSRNSKSGRSRARHVTVPSSQTEILTREAEHRKAWETDGRRVWRNIPKGFELNLERKPRTGSNDSTVNRRTAMSTKSDISGAGPGTAMRPDDVLAVDADTKESEHLSLSLPSHHELSSDASRLDGDIAAPTDSSVSMSIAKPTVKRTSTLQRRQAQVEAELEAQAQADEEVRQAPIVVLASAQPVDIEHEVDEKASDSIPAMSEDEQDEYIRKREQRLRKKEYVLKKRVSAWWQGVTESGLHNTYSTEMPEIDPDIPSPTKELDSSMLRFPPLPASMPDFIGGDSPILRLPSLQVLEDGRKNRSSLGFDALLAGAGGESDVDLLIRLTEMSRVSSASHSGRTRFPTAPPLPKTHILNGGGSGIVTGASVSAGHNLRLRDTMPTPKAKPSLRSAFSGFGSSLDRLPPL